MKPIVHAGLFVCLLAAFAAPGADAFEDRGSRGERSERPIEDRGQRDTVSDRDRDVQRAERDAAERAADLAEAAERASEDTFDAAEDRSGSSGSGSDAGGSSGSGSSGSGSGDSDNSGSGSSGSDNSGSGSDDSDSDDDADAQRENVIKVERDANDNAFREREIVALSDDAAFAGRARALGFAVIEARPLSAVGGEVLRLRAPEGLTSAGALDLLRRTEPRSASAYNHLFAPSGTETKRALPAQVKDLPAVADIGVIDGFASDAIGAWTVDRLAASSAQSGHGDAVAAILLAELADAYGMAPKRLLLEDVVSADGEKGAADVVALVVALDYLTREGMDVINVSLTGPDNAVLARTIERSVKQGPTIVAAGGNGGPAAPPVYPAAYPGVIGVAAVDATGKPWLYSAQGTHIDVAAFGKDTSHAAEAPPRMGTSFAAPRVAALLAAQVRDETDAPERVLVQSARDAGKKGRDPVYGYGIVGLKE